MRSKRWKPLLCFLVLTPGLQAGEPPGLTVGREGLLLKEGKPYRGIGVNCFDAFCRRLKNPEDTSYREGFRKLAQNGIPFVRFAANGFWPVDNDLYRKDKEAYFRLLDDVVKAAEENGLGLVPSFFWHFSTLPDMAGEPLSSWGDPRSQTHEFMRTYTREIVKRYRDSPSIWIWEFGNEYNNQIDHPAPEKHRAPVAPNLGTPASRSEKDDLTQEMMLIAFKEFVRTVRELDPHRAISSGNAITRENAYHGHMERTWKLDSRQEWTKMILQENAPFDLISVHCYAGRPDFFSDKPTDMAGVIAASQDLARKADKPLFVGEFGGSIKTGDKMADHFRILLRAIEKSDVPLAAIWNYDMRVFSKAAGPSLLFENENGWMLKEVAAAHARVQRR